MNSFREQGHGQLLFRLFVFLKNRGTGSCQKSSTASLSCEIGLELLLLHVIDSAVGSGNGIMAGQLVLVAVDDDEVGTERFSAQVVVVSHPVLVLVRVFVVVVLCKVTVDVSALCVNVCVLVVVGVKYCDTSSLTDSTMSFVGGGLCDAEVPQG